MAKIAFITHRVTPAVLHWAESLAGQRNEVIIWTSEDQEIPHLNGVSFQTCFKTWSAREAAQLISVYLVKMPDFFHFILNPDDPPPRPAQWMLLAAARSLRKPTLASALGLGLVGWQWRLFFRAHDGLSFSTRDSLITAKRGGFASEMQQLAVLSPFHAESKVGADDFGQSLFEKVGSYAFIPGPFSEEQLSQVPRTFHRHHLYPVFLGPRPRLHQAASFLTFESLTPEQMEGACRQAKWIVLFLHDFDVFELLSWRERSWRWRVPLLVRPDQLELLPSLCLPERTGRVVDNVLSDELSRTLRRPLGSLDFDRAKKESPDEALNHLNRLYARILS